MKSLDPSLSLKSTVIECKFSLSTQIFWGHDLADELAEFCKALSPRRVLIVDSQLIDSYGHFLAEKLDALLLSIPSGEMAKTGEAQKELIETLFSHALPRDTVIIALGGGATLDMVGFTASIYLRGLPLVFVPTTLLAMVDASIGGKTAIDSPFGKNGIGTFYLPKAIFIDQKFLKTLPENERLNGIAEIAKIGLVYDASLWELVRSNPHHPDLIEKACKAKIAIVEQDFHDQSIRRILNFGHTVAHALETVSSYTMPHGLAVALGCVVEAHLSKELSGFSEGEFEEIVAFFHPFDLHLPASYNRVAFRSALLQDKKRTARSVRSTLLEKIGTAGVFSGAYCHEITQEEWKKSLDWMEKNYG